MMIFFPSTGSPMHVGLLLHHFELPEALKKKKIQKIKQNGHRFAVKASEEAKSPGNKEIY